MLLVEDLGEDVCVRGNVFYIKRRRIFESAYVFLDDRASPTNDEILELVDKYIKEYNESDEIGDDIFRIEIDLYKCKSDNNECLTSNKLRQIFFAIFTLAEVKDYNAIVDFFFWFTSSLESFIKSDEELYSLVNNIYYEIRP